MLPLTVPLILEARRAVDGRVRRTPLEASPRLSEIAGAPVSLKLENLQLTGSFKIRGAFFKLGRLAAEDRARGVVTCSAGNHGKAVAHVARELGIRATIYVPRSVDESKYGGMVAMAADVVRSDFDGFDETEQLARLEAERSGRLYVSAYDDTEILAANGGTLAAEVLEDAPEARTFLLPVGGGGLAGGFAFFATASVPDARIVGCQLEASAALPLSLDAHQYLIEPSSAVTVAAILTGKAAPIGTPAVAVVSGRNVALATVRRILAA
jgi:threonine dehydratase